MDIIRPINENVGLITKNLEGVEGKNFALACFVTAYSRIILYEMISKILKLGFNPLYCDTDSCYFSGDDIFKDTKKLYENFDIGTELGDVSLKLYKSGEFRNVKDYELSSFFEKEYIKLKGVPKDKRREFADTGHTSYKRPMKLRPALRGKQSLGINEWYDIEVERHSEYRKRIINKDGFTEALTL
jgi:hypothetical protein